MHLVGLRTLYIHTSAAGYLNVTQEEVLQRENKEGRETERRDGNRYMFILM